MNRHRTAQPCLRLGAVLNGPDHATHDDAVPLASERQRQMIGAELRRHAEAALEAHNTADSAELRATLDRVRAMADILRLAIRSRIVTDTDGARTDRQLAHPLTLTDYLAALEHAGATHRLPHWYRPERSDLRDIVERIDMLAGLVGRIPGAIEAAQKMGGGL
jgi:hypothetical protein